MLPRPHDSGAESIRLGKYQLIRHLATGGMAEVHLARAEGIEGFEKVCVVKRILPEIARKPDGVKLFLDEARLAASLHHPNLVQVYDVGVEDGLYFYAMEYVHGHDVRAIFHRARESGMPVGIAESIGVVLGVCSGMHYAHERADDQGRPIGLIHRDLSPSNVLVSFDGAVKVADFGVAKTSSQSTKTRAGVVRGKINYMSPEQCRCLELDRRSDVFAITILLYELTTGTRLYRGASDFDVMKQIVEHDAPAPSARRGDYPAELERIVRKGLARDPVRRYPTAQELQLDLEDFARERKLAVSPVGLARRMEVLFAPSVEALRVAQREGRTLVDHLLATDLAGSFGDEEDVSSASAETGARPPTASTAAASLLAAPTTAAGPGRARWYAAAALVALAAAALWGFVLHRRAPATTTGSPVAAPAAQGRSAVERSAAAIGGAADGERAAGAMIGAAAGGDRGPAAKGAVAGGDRAAAANGAAAGDERSAAGNGVAGDERAGEGGTARQGGVVDGALRDDARGTRRHSQSTRDARRQRHEQHAAPAPEASAPPARPASDPAPAAKRWDPEAPLPPPAEWRKP